MTPAHDIVVIGASAGGVQSLMQLVEALPASLPAALFVVLHVPANAPSVLPDILNRKGHLPALHVHDKQEIIPGHIYVAPPDYHLLLNHSVMHLSHGPRENHVRPAIDVLFRSAAENYGSRVIGVVLSGALYDGTAGLITIKRHGGVAIVQDPQDALFPSMPQSAVRWDHPDYILPLSQIPATLLHLVEGAPQDLQGGH